MRTLRFVLGHGRAYDLAPGAYRLQHDRPGRRAVAGAVDHPLADRWGRRPTQRRQRPDAGAEPVVGIAGLICRAGGSAISALAIWRMWRGGASSPTSRQVIYEHLQRLSLRFYENKQTGQLMSRMVNDSDLFERLIAHAMPDVLVNVLTFIGVSAGADQHELAAGAAEHGAHPTHRARHARLCPPCAAGLPRATEGAGRAERHAERQPVAASARSRRSRRRSVRRSVSARTSTTTATRCCARCG